MYVNVSMWCGGLSISFPMSGPFLLLPGAGVMGHGSWVMRDDHGFHGS